jgi:hypothetical protein
VLWLRLCRSAGRVILANATYFLGICEQIGPL